MADYSPGATVGEVSDRFFRSGVGVGLVDVESDGVRRGRFCER